MVYFQLKLTALKQVAFTAKLVVANVKILNLQSFLCFVTVIALQMTAYAKMLATCSFSF